MDDEHFLTRLDRLGPGEIDDALALYYDRPLVEALLGQVADRGTADRVAISLDDPDEGPFIIVGQDGNFVTTLARGMRPSDELVIVPRASWDRIRRENERIREAWDHAKSLSVTRLRSLRSEVETHGPFVSRETILDLITLSKVLEPDFIRWWMSSIIDLTDAMELVSSRAQFKQLDHSFYNLIGRAAWTVGHLMVVLGASDLKRRPHDDLIIRTLEPVRPTRDLVRLGMAGPLMRGIWMIGKLGPIWFDTLKETFRTSESRYDVFDAALGLASIGGRFSKYRGEVKKLLDVRRPADDGPYRDILRYWAGTVAGATLIHDVPRENLRRYVVAGGAGTWVNNGPPPGHPLHFERAEDVPDDLSIPAFFALADDVWAEGAALIGDLMGMFLPAALGEEAAAMYYPARIVAKMGRWDGVEQVRPMFQRLRAETTRGQRTQPAAAPKVGRNEPCPCGSGKKYKRCCGA